MIFICCRWIICCSWSFSFLFLSSISKEFLLVPASQAPPVAFAAAPTAVFVSFYHWTKFREQWSIKSIRECASMLHLSMLNPSRHPPATRSTLISIHSRALNALNSKATRSSTVAWPRTLGGLFPWLWSSRNWCHSLWLWSSSRRYNFDIICVF